jgi:transcriptional regulator with XRE-family HTH domain
MSSFGDRLKNARKRKYASAEQFANALLLHPHRYRKYERGKSQPDFETLTRICHLLEITPNDLLPDAAHGPGTPSRRPQKAGAQPKAA